MSNHGNLKAKQHTDLETALFVLVDPVAKAHRKHVAMRLEEFRHGINGGVIWETLLLKGTEKHVNEQKRRQRRRKQKRNRNTNKMIIYISYRVDCSLLGNLGEVLGHNDAASDKGGAGILLDLQQIRALLEGSNHRSEILCDALHTLEASHHTDGNPF